MGRLGWAEILVIVVLLVILFGHSKIPGMMKNLANGINVFKKEIKNTDDEKKPVAKNTATKKPLPKKKTAGVKKRSVKKTK